MGLSRNDSYPLAINFKRPKILNVTLYSEIQKTTLSKQKDETAPELDICYLEYTLGVFVFC